jgi:hypothetical protein
VHGRLSAVEETRRGQEESADAHRPEAASRRGDPSQPAEERRISHRAGGDPTNNQHRVRAPIDVTIVSMREE